MRQKFTSRNAVTTVEGGQLIGECRGRQLGQTRPVRIVEHQTATRAQTAIDGLTISQHTLATEMGNEFALPHAQQPLCISRSATSEKICVAFKAIGFATNDSKHAVS